MALARIQRCASTLSAYDYTITYMQAWPRALQCRSAKSIATTGHTLSGSDVPLPGITTTSSGPVSFEVRVEYGRLVRRHVNHIRLRTVDSAPSSSDDLDDPDLPQILDDRDEPPGNAPVGNECAQGLHKYSRIRHPPDHLI